MIINLNSMKNFHLKNHILKLKFLIFIISGRQAAPGRGRESILMKSIMNEITVFESELMKNIIYVRIIYMNFKNCSIK